jgi:hypothetical protein
MKSTFIACFAAAAGASAAWAGESVTIDLTGVEIRHGGSVQRTSAPDTLDPAFAYRYSIDGMVQGSGLGLGTLFPSPTPLAEAMEALAPGSSEFLEGLVCNPSGEHPFELVGQRFEGETVVSGITVEFGATFGAGIGADDIAWFSITDITLSPSLLVGSLKFVSGEVVVERVACRPDVDGSGSLDFFDFLAFQNLYGAGEPAADFDCNGELDFFDFLAFQNAFAAGCP